MFLRIFLFFLLLPAMARAEIKISWLDLNTDRSPEILKYSQSDILSFINEAASEFSRSFEDLGPVDFGHCKKDFFFAFHGGDVPDCEQLFGDRTFDLVYIKPSLVNASTPNELKRIFFHELSHLYDNFILMTLQSRSRGDFDGDESAPKSRLEILKMKVSFRDKLARVTSLLTRGSERRAKEKTSRCSF